MSSNENETNWAAPYFSAEMQLVHVKNVMKGQLAIVGKFVDTATSILQLERVGVALSLVAPLPEEESMPTMSPATQSQAAMTTSKTESSPDASKGPEKTPSDEFQLLAGQTVGINFTKTPDFIVRSNDNKLIPGVFGAVNFRTHYNDTPGTKSLYLINGSDVTDDMWPHKEVPKNEFFENKRHLIGIVDGEALSSRLHGPGDGVFIELSQQSDGKTTYVAMASDETGNPRAVFAKEITDITQRDSAIARVTVTEDFVTIGAVSQSNGDSKNDTFAEISIKTMGEPITEDLLPDNTAMYLAMMCTIEERMVKSGNLPSGVESSGPIPLSERLDYQQTENGNRRLPWRKNGNSHAPISGRYALDDIAVTTSE